MIDLKRYMIDNKKNIMKQLVLAGLIIVLAFSCRSKKELTDTNEVVNSTQNRSDRNQRGTPPSIDEVFKMDANGDGLLAKSEVTGRLLKDFERFDSNSDGFISKEEFNIAPRPKRRRGESRNN